MTFTTFEEKYSHPSDVRCRCNLCCAEFTEGTILIDDDSEREYCPVCFETGYIQSEGE